jgi:hypothetical protein
MCNETGTHCFGMRNCPEAHALINDGLIGIDPGGRYVMKDGKPLIRGENGFAATLRAQIRERSGTTSAVEVVGRGFEAVNHEFVQLGNILYDTAPAELSQGPAKTE